MPSYASSTPTPRAGEQALRLLDDAPAVQCRLQLLDWSASGIRPVVVLKRFSAPTGCSRSRSGRR